MTDTTTNEREIIYGLLAFLDANCRPGYRNLLTALVAERDMLSVEVGGLRSAMKAQDDRERDAGERCGVNRDMSGCDWPDAVADEVIALKQRVAELEAHPPADRDLRERLVCAALNGILSEQRGLLNHEYALRAIGLADATLAAMRKGDSDGK